MKQETLQLTGGTGNQQRRELDFYPTPRPVTIALMDFLFKEERLDFNTTIWEPACGDGHMSEVLKEYCPDVYSTDIRDTGYGDQFDFINNSRENMSGEFDAIITNPPFKLSGQFIEKALKESRVVCMLLKSQYWHAKGRHGLFIKNPPAYVLPLTWRPDFLEHERKAGDKKGAPTMEVAWTVWVRGNFNSKYIPLPKP